MHIALFILMYAYLQIGRFVGEWSLNVWKSSYKYTLSTRILFPYHAFAKIVGDNKEAIVEDSTRPAYLFLMAFVWPLKFLWTIVFYGFTSPFYGLYLFSKKIFCALYLCFKKIYSISTVENALRKIGSFLGSVFRILLFPESATETNWKQKWADWKQRRAEQRARKTQVRVETNEPTDPIAEKRERVRVLATEIATRMDEKTSLEAEIEFSNGYRGAPPALREAQAKE